MLELLGLEPGEAVALEDSEVGIAAAKAAGLSCYAVTGTHPPIGWPLRTESSSGWTRTSSGGCWRRLQSC